jgi:hypothetical protein
VLVLERLKWWPEVETGPKFKISDVHAADREMRFRIEHEDEHEHEKILAKKGF